MKLVALLFALCFVVCVPRLRAEEQASSKAKKLTYQEYVKLYEKDSKIAKLGEPLMIDDKMSVEVRGQVATYDGLDRGEGYCSFVVRYMNEKKVGVRTLRNPIISIKPMKRLEGAPKKAVAGDVEVGDYTVHIISATDKECRYVVEKQESEE
ncbi:MAG: hypothetical protein K8Q97_01105 [Candidatus Andersenbacteria bacterium]|nr:hypothetical protein [Candidatus Andersenbacteria bacterium]